LLNVVLYNIIVVVTGGQKVGEKERENVIWDDIYRLFLYYNEKKALKIKKSILF